VLHHCKAETQGKASSLYARFPFKKSYSAPSSQEEIYYKL